MTTLADILINGRLPVGWDAPGHGLLFSTAVRDAILAAQDDTMHHRISPVATSDCRWLSCADVLTEAINGIYSGIFSRIDWALAAAVEVLPWADAIALLPPPEPMDDQEPQRARNPDGTYRADDPSTPDVNEAWV
jgi:hypothetical protein